MVQVNGTPQGSVISPTLFLIGISDLPNIIEAPVKYSVFADDLTIYMTSSNFSLLKEFLQNATNKLNAWSTQQGLRLSPSKTKCIIFSNKQKNPPNCIIKIGNESIENVSTIRILGLTLDRKLSWNDHIHNLKNQGIKSLNVLKMTAHKNWGADRKTLKNLYQSLSLSKIDYGSIIYNSAKSSTLKKLEPIQNSALRLIIGAMYTSPVSSLHVEANVLPLKFRRCFLSIKYYIKLLTRTTNSTYPNTVNPNFYSLNLKKANIPKPLGIRCKIDIENSNLQVPHNLTPNIIANFQKQLKKNIAQRWQIDWHALSHTSKLFQIKPEITEWKSAYRTNRREETIIGRLRIGHCLNTHSYIFHKTPAPMCENCREALTVDHFLSKCTLYNNQRKTYFNKTQCELYEMVTDD